MQRRPHYLLAGLLAAVPWCSAFAHELPPRSHVHFREAAIDLPPLAVLVVVGLVLLGLWAMWRNGRV